VDALILDLEIETAHAPVLVLALIIETEETGETSTLIITPEETETLTTLTIITEVKDKT